MRAGLTTQHLACGPGWQRLMAAVPTLGGIIVIASHRLGQTLFPAGTVFFHLLVVVPMFIVAAGALMGFAQLMLGMRENMVINMLTILLLFGALAIARMVVEKAQLVTWPAVLGLLMASVVLLLSTSMLGRFLSRERIVRTIS